jgi:hypothetical protein
MLKPGGVWINLGIYDPRSFPSFLCYSLLPYSPSALLCLRLPILFLFTAFCIFISPLLLVSATFFVLFSLTFFLLSSPSLPFSLSRFLLFSSFLISSNDSITSYTTPNMITTSCTYVRAQVPYCTTG